MKYDVHTVARPEDIDHSPKLPVADYRWLRGYEPETWASVVYVRDSGFLIRMDCLEKAPKAVYTQPDSPVCRDSCMECFINFAPENDGRYINMEANSIGTLHCKIGTGRGSARQPLRDMGIAMPMVRASVAQDSWRLEFFVPLDCVRALFGRDGFTEGDVIKANFYKCGDETAQPHYGMWSGVDSAQPDFHRPEYFGDLIIRE